MLLLFLYSFVLATFLLGCLHLVFLKFQCKDSEKKGSRHLLASNPGFRFRICLAALEKAWV